MAENLDFPIVLGMKPLSKLGILALGIFLFGYGVAVQGSGRDVSTPIGIHISESTLGVFAILLGVGIGLASVQAMVSGRPKVVLNPDGLAFSPNIGSVRQLVWADILSVTTYSNRYASGVDIRTRGDQSVKIPALGGSADDLRELIIRCATAAGTPSPTSA